MLRFSGLFTALITPFQQGNLDEKSWKRLVEHQMEGGVDGLVINGTTGESPNLTRDEVKQLFQWAKAIVGDQLPIVLGTGSNSTEKTIETTRWAQDLGADAALVVVPYYNKPPQEGLAAHYKAIAELSNLDIILYNVPGRTVTDLKPDTVAALSKHRNIIGIKDATGSMEVLSELRRKCPSNFLLTSGDDPSAAEFMMNGGDGVISVISNVLPAPMKKMVDYGRAGDPNCRETWKQLQPINETLTVTTNPIPIKMACYLAGLIDSPELRLPLMQMHEAEASAIKKALKDSGWLA